MTKYLHFSLSACLYNGDSFEHGADWKPYGLRDPCFECKCSNGEFSCETKKCPQINCENAVADVGECCPRCPGKRKYFIIILAIYTQNSILYTACILY